MSKVICDVCGTAYPETASVCPICNSARKSAEQTIAASTTGGEAESSTYNHVKGGRFSKKNVRKRSKAGTVAAKRHDNDEEEPSNTGLIIVVILLLLAIVAVVIYIGVHFFGQSDNQNDPSNQNNPSSNVSTEDTRETEPTKADVPCQGIQLSNKVIEFTAEGESWTLEVAVNPISCTDTVMFSSSDESVVTVAADGTITAVGGGEAIITVTCGSIVDTCTVTCSFGDATQDPTEETTGVFFFEFNTSYTDSATGYGDTTLNGLGSTWRAYKKNLTVPLSEITWTSDDPSVCTIKDGIVTVVGAGRTLIHAQCNGVTYTCIVRCVVPTTPTPTEPAGDTEATEPGEGGETGETTVTYTINKTDVTIAVNETFKLTLTDNLGFVQDVTWVADGSGVSIDGNKITGVYSGIFHVSVTIDGTTYSCIVRVK